METHKFASVGYELTFYNLTCVWCGVHDFISLWKSKLVGNLNNNITEVDFFGLINFHTALFICFSSLAPPPAPLRPALALSVRSLSWRCVHVPVKMGKMKQSCVMSAAWRRVSATRSPIKCLLALLCTIYTYPFIHVDNYRSSS